MKGYEKLIKESCKHIFESCPETYDLVINKEACSKGDCTECWTKALEKDYVSRGEE